MALCESLGADRVVDYKKEDVVEALINGGDKFDHAVDNVGSNKPLIWRSHEFMRPGTTFVGVGAQITFADAMDAIKQKLLPGFLGGLKNKVVGVFPSPNTEDLRQIGEWMSEGKVRAVIDSRYAFEDAPKAFERLKTGRAKGKIVIDVAPEMDAKGSS